MGRAFFGYARSPGQSREARTVHRPDDFTGDREERIRNAAVSEINGTETFHFQSM